MDFQGLEVTPERLIGEVAHLFDELVPFLAHVEFTKDRIHHGHPVDREAVNKLVGQHAALEPAIGDVVD